MAGKTKQVSAHSNEGGLSEWEKWGPHVAVLVATFGAIVVLQTHESLNVLLAFFVGLIVIVAAGYSLVEAFRQSKSYFSVDLKQFLLDALSHPIRLSRAALQGLKQYLRVAVEQLRRWLWPTGAATSSSVASCLIGGAAGLFFALAFAADAVSQLPAGVFLFWIGIALPPALSWLANNRRSRTRPNEQAEEKQGLPDEFGLSIGLPVGYVLILLTVRSDLFETRGARIAWLTLTVFALLFNWVGDKVQLLPMQTRATLFGFWLLVLVNGNWDSIF